MSEHLTYVCRLCGREQKFNIPQVDDFPLMTPRARAHDQAATYGWTWKNGEAICCLHQGEPDAAS